MNLLLVIFVFSCATLHFAECYNAFKYECPEADLGKCRCVDVNGKVFLYCTGLVNPKELTEAFQNMTGYGINFLQIKDSNISHIPRNLFRGSPVSQIRVKKCSMFFLFDRDVEDHADQITDIVLDYVEFTGGLDWTVLENLISLKTFSVKGTNVEGVPYGASELELPLETLVLVANKIEYVYDMAFQNLNNLKNLKLSNNFLNQYARNILPLPSSGIQFLDLSHNNLKSLPADAFDGMPELHSLLLNGNKFTVLEKSYMKNIFPSLVFLDVSINPLECSCELTWLLSDNKPFHLFGECSPNKGEKRALKDLTSKDFDQCSKYRRKMNKRNAVKKNTPQQM